MNTQFLIAQSIIIILAFVGWFIVHWLNSNHDRSLKRREIRLNYLISTYQKLANASQRKPEDYPENDMKAYIKDLESVVADIQLFGTKSQIELVKPFIKEWIKTGEGKLDSLLNDLRDKLRKELELSKIRGNVQWIRMTKRKQT